MNIPNGNGNSPLIVAAAKGHVDMINKLIALDANVDYIDVEGNTVLIFSANYNQLESCKLLLKAGANPNIKNKKGLTALKCLQCSKERYAIIRELILHGANDDSPLSLAVKNNDVFIVKKILEISKNIKARNKSLAIATQKHNLAIIRLLMRC